MSFKNVKNCTHFFLSIFPLVKETEEILNVENTFSVKGLFVRLGGGLKID